jgi:hypothetical protein
MNKFTTLAIAGAIGFLGLVYGFSAPAAADGRAELIANAYGDLLGRPAGEANGLIGLLNQENSGRKAGELVPAVLPSDKTGITDGTRGTNGDGRAGLITEAYGDVLNRPAGGQNGGEANGLIGLLNKENVGLKPVISDGTRAANGDGKADVIVGAGGGKLASLNGVGSVGELFALSRGDNGTPPVRGSAVQGAGPQVKVFNGKTTLGGNPAVNPGEVKKLNFSNQVAAVGKSETGKSAGGNMAGDNGRIDPAAAKGLNFTRTPR